jgi:hypothetical protein
MAPSPRTPRTHTIALGWLLRPRAHDRVPQSGRGSRAQCQSARVAVSRHLGGAGRGSRPGPAGRRLPGGSDTGEREDARRGPAHRAPTRDPLVAPDSFAAGEIARELGAAGEGMFVTVPGIPPEQLPPAGRRFLRAFGGPAFVDRGALGAPEAAQATEVLLDAIARSDGTRASVVGELFETNVVNGHPRVVLVRPLRRHRPCARRRLPLRSREDRRRRRRASAARRLRRLGSRA